MAIPSGFEGVVRGRSGLSSRGIRVEHGTIDSGYRGQVGVIIHNASGVAYGINIGDRIAQLAIRKAPAVTFDVVGELDETERGASGFGSSGLT
jgi:dUTP pyrophosphatase